MTRLLLASLLLTACSHTPDAAPTGVGEDPPRAASGPLLRDREAPPAPRARKASRSRAITRTGTLTDTTCYLTTGHRTASGLWPRVGMAASNRYPFSTRLRVQRVGVVTVQDRIGHGSSLDLFMASRSACVQFGRQQLRVAVLR